MHSCDLPAVLFLWLFLFSNAEETKKDTQKDKWETGRETHQKENGLSNCHICVNSIMLTIICCGATCHTFGQRWWQTTKDKLRRFGFKYTGLNEDISCDMLSCFSWSTYHETICMFVCCFLVFFSFSNEFTCFMMSVWCGCVSLAADSTYMGPHGNT